jgi:hypothetical protein
MDFGETFEKTAIVVKNRWYELELYFLDMLVCVWERERQTDTEKETFTFFEPYIMLHVSNKNQ